MRDPIANGGNMVPALLLTRPQLGSERVLQTIEALVQQKVDHVISPLLRIVDVPVPDRITGDVVLTSPEGARRAFELGASGTAYCVGDRTAEIATAHGMTSISAGWDAEKLITLIRDHAPTGDLVHVRGKYARGNVAQRLTEGGIPCRALVAYDQQGVPLTDAARALLRGDKTVVVPLFSPRSAGLLWDQVPDPGDAVRFVTISPAAAQELGQTSRISASPDFDGMIAAIHAEMTHIRAS